MLNYYYHPLLGLQYTYLEDLITIDIDAIPQDLNFDTEKWLKYLKATGCRLVDPTSTNYFQITGQIINY